ncbi:uncharacterized protein LOC8278857 [Ricinus communis]|uniref:DNA binding protein, putative n=1 Tax=Ricinus communis TaxID=3988 RepID=B9R7B1_RICCO|nr:uncharacterized protein LOC8278857 [Ricinus communis]XP_015576293.1 uncharacterized protein LOC8278857 [Ricinus communis]EEF52391.1 DNA binding protein, putative [Ricinus communis]|eukprot:XP_002510204.1 uncharacterized protein LOC8278857 [Ricinus communis]
MAELVYQERSSSRSGYRARDASPDSVIFTLESNFSLFSSASASVDRCSFASDAHDRDSLASEISLHLAGHEVGSGVGGGNELRETLSGPDRDPDPNKLVIHSSNTKQQHAHAHSRLFKKVEKVKVQKEDSSKAAIELLEEDSSNLIDSARNSFSLALKECQERRSRSEAVTKKADRRRPASLDLNNVIAASSPRLSGMKKSTTSSRKSGTFPSPGTPNYRHASVGMQKGWSSERVPLHNLSNNRRQQANANASLLLPNGRTLPSKWEDAERWIFSPVSGDGGMRTSINQVPQRRPKSKSGPLGPPGIAYYSLYSPAMPVFDGGNMGNFMSASSPFSAGVIAADGLGMRSNGNGVAFPVRTEPCMARSVSVHGCSEVLPQSSSASQDEKLDGVKDAATDLSSVSRRDMATQMSPEGSNHSSPSMRTSFSASTPSILPIVEVQSVHTSKSQVRDVQVDERVTVTRWSKKHRSRNQGKNSEIVDDWRKKSVDARSSPWDVSEAAKCISKAKREEAKITAWENLQKAKAEAAIRKLEMKLERKRSSSMDKIMNKLRSAQKRAQEMRSSVLTNQANQVSRTSHKAISFRRTRQMGSLSGCFTCHAF